MATQLENLRQKAEQLFEQEKSNDIIELLSDNVLEKHKDAELYAWRARAHYGSSAEIDLRMQYANKAIETDSNFWMGYFAIGYAWATKGEYDKAITDYNKAIDFKPDYATAYNNRGGSWSNKGEYDKAITDYNKAIELKPDYATAYNNRGLTWNHKSEYDKAIADFNKAIELKPDYADAFFGRGDARDSKGEYDKAIEDYNQAINLKSDYAIAYGNRGISWGKKGEYDKAIADFSKVIELKYDDAIAYFNRALAWDFKGEYDKVIADYNKAIELRPDYADAIYNLALAFEKRGKLKEAIEKFKSVKALNYRTSDSEFKINEIKERLVVKLKEDIDQDIEKIKSIVSVIRQKSLSGNEVKQVVHYSKLYVADKITNDCHSCLHYSNVIYMNDPEEGKKFIEYLGDVEIKQWFEKASYKNESTIFLGSFLPVRANDEDGNAEDQLLLWRTYGKDEKGVDAAGCNFVINNVFFDIEKTKTIAALPKTFQEIKEAIENGARFTDDSRNRLLKVQYLRGTEILKDDNKLIASLIIYLKEEIKKLIAKNEKEVVNEDSKLYTDSQIFDALQELCHLFKSADYSFEKEVRIIRKESRNSKCIEYYKQPGEKEPSPPRHFYVKSEKRILPYLQKIYLGPKVKDPSHWSLHFDHSLRQAEQKEKKELPKLIDLEDKFKNQGTVDGNEKEILEKLRKLYPGPMQLKKK